MARLLLLMRHGKSAYPDGVEDHDRPLSARGTREAGLAGDWVRAGRIVVEAVLCSTARRTRQTLTCTGLDAAVHFSPTLYDATAEQVLAEIAAAEATFGGDVATLLVVGHQPAMGEVAHRLAGAGSDGAARAGLTATFPTSAIALVDTEAPWSAITEAPSSLREVHVPR